MGNKLILTTTPEAKAKLKGYPEPIQSQMKALRTLILATAENMEAIDQLEECLKWGELSYVCKTGSTFRIDWKEKQAEYIGIYFNCNSSLVATFRAYFGSQFQYEKNRAILLPANEPLPSDNLTTCFELALSYHKIKHLPMLGL